MVSITTRTMACPCSLSGRSPSRSLMRANSSFISVSLQVPPGPAGATEAPRQLLHPATVAQQRVHARWVEQRAAMGLEVVEGLVHRPGALVRALGDQRVEHVGNRDDACFHRDGVAAQAGRIAAAVVAFLVVQRDGGAELDETVLAAAEQLVADLGMLAHQ